MNDGDRINGYSPRQWAIIERMRDQENPLDIAELTGVPAGEVMALYTDYLVNCAEEEDRADGDRLRDLARIDTLDKVFSAHARRAIQGCHKSAAQAIAAAGRLADLQREYRADRDRRRLESPAEPEYDDKNGDPELKALVYYSRRGILPDGATEEDAAEWEREYAGAES